MIPQISIVIPAYNEGESLPHSHAHLMDVLDREQLDAEVIYVDDGSRDDSHDFYATACKADPRVRVIALQRNQGKSAALSVGFQACRGEIVVTLDADGQDEPEEIPRLLSALEEGYDLVVGWKYPRLDPSHKVMASGLFNRVVSTATGIRLHDMNCGFKVMRREVAQSIEIYGELHRFFVPLAHLSGFCCREHKVRHHPRQYGQSKFGARRYVEGVFDLVTILFLSHFRVRPMHLFGGGGAALLLLGMGINLYLTVLWFAGQPLGNRPMLFLGMLLCIVGIQLLSTGLLGEMLVRNSHGSMKYPERYRLGGTE